MKYIFLLFTAVLLSSCSNDTVSGSTASEKEEIIDFKGIKIYKNQKKVEVEGTVCINYGILEYLIVSKDGRTYESVFAIDCNPSHLNAALLLVGAKQSVFPDEFKGDKKGDKKGQKSASKKDGSYFNIYIEWISNGKSNKTSAETFLWDRDKKEALKNIKWIFTGSYFGKDFKGNELFMADVEKTVVAVWYDGTALFNLPVLSKNPYRGDSFGFEINEKIISKVGTKVKIFFELANDK